MTEEERKAMEWMDWCEQGGAPSVAKNVATLKAMLAEPRLPKELSDELVEAIWWACDGGNHRVVAEKIVAAIRAYVTKPATKTVEVWRLEYAERHHVTGRWLADARTWPNREKLEGDAKEMRAEPAKYACIRVTGPHQQEVPA